MMTFTHSHTDSEGKTSTSVTYVIHDENAGIDVIISEFKLFLLAVSFSEELIDRYINVE